jgi:hypothetical protein
MLAKRRTASWYSRRAASVVLLRSVSLNPRSRLERTGQRLVEVVEVEDDPALGRCEHTEVR